MISYQVELPFLTSKRHFQHFEEESALSLVDHHKDNFACVRPRREQKKKIIIYSLYNSLYNKEAGVVPPQPVSKKGGKK